MPFASAYTSKKANDDGRFPYSAEENEVWADLIERQTQIVPNRAVSEFIRGLEDLQLPKTHVPQVEDVNRKLDQLTGFGVEAVPALIAEEEFFRLLARRKFPVATFVRRREEIDYLKEPDIFHEIYGHCPLLAIPEYANAIESFGRVAVELGPAYYSFIRSIFWFTIEFGLTQTSEGLRFYGAGIASSAKESVVCLEGAQVIQRPFSFNEIIHKDYRIDALQSTYYTLPELRHLYDIASNLKKELSYLSRSSIYTTNKNCPEAA